MTASFHQKNVVWKGSTNRPGIKRTKRLLRFLFCWLFTAHFLQFKPYFKLITTQKYKVLNIFNSTQEHPQSNTSFTQTANKTFHRHHVIMGRSRDSSSKTLRLENQGCYLFCIRFSKELKSFWKAVTYFGVRFMLWHK